MFSFVAYWHLRVADDLVFDVFKIDHFFRPGTDQLTWLVVHLVVYLGAVVDQLTELVPFHIRVVLALDLTHVLDFVNSAHNAEVEEGEIRVVNEVLRVQDRVGQIDHTHCYELAVKAVIKVIAAIPWIDF